MLFIKLCIVLHTNVRWINFFQILLDVKEIFRNQASMVDIDIPEVITTQWEGM